MPNQNDKNNLGLFALLFGAIFGVTYGAYKAVKGAGIDSELERMRAMIDEYLFEGKNEVEITNALMTLASEQMGDKFTQDVADKLKAWVLEEKIKLRKEKKI